ncbi:hypothetical protein Lal_00008516 [Lupinus albus]|nr:hypothetical protein Lal_00008516 [Lupinus albus]
MDNFDLRILIARTHAGAIIPALMHRIPSELRRMGDLLGSPRVAPLFFTGGSINGLEILKMVFWGGTDRRRVSQRIEWKILPRMHILYVEF